MKIAGALKFLILRVNYTFLYERGCIFMKRNEVNKTMRELLGLTQQQLGERVGVSRQLIAMYEQGRTERRTTVRVIELELDIAIDNCTEGSIKEECKKLKTLRKDETV